jgi:hypothetical protein
MRPLCRDAMCVASCSQTRVLRLLDRPAQRVLAPVCGQAALRGLSFFHRSNVKRSIILAAQDRMLAVVARVLQCRVADGLRGPLVVAVLHGSPLLSEPETLSQVTGQSVQIRLTAHTRLFRR